MMNKKPRKITAEMEADFRADLRKRLELMTAKKAKELILGAKSKAPFAEGGPIATTDGGTMWLGGGGGSTWTTTTGTSTWATGVASGSGWSGGFYGGAGGWGTATLYPSSTVSTSWTWDDYLTDDQRGMIQEVILDQLEKFGPGTPKTYSWVPPWTGGSGTISETVTSIGTVTWDET